MGKKSNIIGSRLGQYRSWMSKWYAKEGKQVSSCFQRDLLIRDFLLRTYERRGFFVGKLKISRRPRKTNVKIYVYSQKRLPTSIKQSDIIIHKALIYLDKGNNVDLKVIDIHRAVKRKVTRAQRSLSRRLSSFRLRSYLKHSINVIGGALVFKSASLLSKYLASHIEKDHRHSQFLNYLKKALPLFLKTFPNIKGLRVDWEGRLNSSERSKHHWFKLGSTPLQNFQGGVDYGFTPAFTRYGVCGIHVWLFYDKSPNE